MQTVKTFGVVALLVALIAAVVVFALPQATTAQAVCYSAGNGGLRVAGLGCEYEFQSGSVFDRQAQSRFLVSANNVTSATITNTAVLGSLYGYQSLNPVLTSTVSLTSTGYVAGDNLTLFNKTVYPVTINDSGIVKASGNIVLGQYDIAHLWFDGTNWIEVGGSDN